MRSGALRAASANGTARMLLAALVLAVAGLAARTTFAKGTSLAVELTAPDNGAMYMAPATISLAATITLIDGKGKDKNKNKDKKGEKNENHKGNEGHGNPHQRVVKVEFLQGPTVIGTATAAPYTFNWVNVPAGNYLLSARAVNAKGETVDSTPVVISVGANAAPTVTLTAPAPNTVVTAPANITVSADAADSNGTVSQVEFFANGNAIGTATTSPFTIQWENVTAGNYSLTAQATDNNNAQTTSDPVSITVKQVAQVYYIHPDHLNTPRAITNQGGQLVWAWANDDPFGANVPNENPSGLGTFSCNLRLPGQYFDQETNNHYNMARDYSPDVGRYIQSDTIGLLGGLNTYAYVRGNPLTRIDPTGEFILVPVVVGVAAITVGTLGGVVIVQKINSANQFWVNMNLLPQIQMGRDAARRLCSQDDQSACAAAAYFEVRENQCLRSSTGAAGDFSNVDNLPGMTGAARDVLTNILRGR